MLDLRPNCECCDRDLPGDSPDAFICSYECTFCRACTESLDATCPNCGGQLVQRPARDPEKWASDPPSRRRVHKPEGCSRAKQPLA